MWCQAALGLIHGYPEGSLGMSWQHVCDGCKRSAASGLQDGGKQGKVTFAERFPSSFLPIVSQAGNMRGKLLGKQRPQQGLLQDYGGPAQVRQDVKEGDLQME